MITIEELRKMLYLIDNQEMTIEELRRILFDQKNQEELLSEIIFSKICNNKGITK